MSSRVLRPPRIAVSRTANVVKLSINFLMLFQRLDARPAVRLSPALAANRNDDPQHFVKSLTVYSALQFS
jgi:hypothetical protein